MGYVDSVDSNGVVRGWVADASNPMVPIAVHFYIDGTSPNNFAGVVEPFEQFNRPDVWQAFNWGAANHGFAFTIPNSSPNDPSVSLNFRNSTTHTVHVYGIALSGPPSSLGGNLNTPVLPNLPVSLTQPLFTNGKVCVAPNQMAACLWYRPLPLATTVINGHIEGSFDHFDYWPTLNGSIRRAQNGFGVFAAEIGHMTGATLQKFRAAGIPNSVEAPAFTQCYDGAALATLEFDGESPENANWFCSRFDICPEDSPNPLHVGWFRTEDNLPYAPEEIILDERIPNLVPFFDPEILKGPYNQVTWEQKKINARTETCLAASSFNPGVPRITGLINDYVEYAAKMKLHFAPAPSPRLSFHWNVNPAWEWRDEAWLDQLHYDNVVNHNSDPDDFMLGFLYLRNPLHNGTKHLEQLVQAMCANGTCPDTVYMDMELIHASETQYALDVLRRNKAVLQANDVKFGISLVDQCGDTEPGCAINMTPGGASLYKITRDPAYFTPNMLYEESILNITNYLLINGIIDGNTKIRMGGWTRRPIESGSAVNENNIGGVAHIANRVINEYLNPQGIDRSFHQNGLAATYFDNSNFTGPTVKRRDPSVNFDWGVGSPSPAIAPTDFSARWVGQVWAGHSETYTFYTLSDDGVALWVNNQLLIYNWTNHGPTENSATINLVRGRKYDIKLEYYQGGGGATMKLSWSSPSQPKQVIPEGRFSSGKGNNFDFDGDIKTDLAVYRPLGGNWHIIDSSTGVTRIVQWGQPGDVPVPADYDRDGKVDIAVWRPSNGTWYIINSSTGSMQVQQVGANGDLPVPADYDGDGKADAAVWRPSNGTWYIIDSSTGGSRQQQWGQSTDKPVPADYDRDGKADIAVWRPADGNWHIRNSSTDSTRVQQWGRDGDQPVPADYDGDGRADTAVWRPSNGNWYIINSSTVSRRIQQWGQLGDKPVPGDYDADGTMDLAVWRPTEGKWYIVSSSTGLISSPLLGLNGDIPAPSAFIR